MAEEPEIEIERPEPTTTADVALATALDEARAAPNLNPKVAAFFEAQTRLADDQRHHMAAQFKLELWSKRLKLLLQGLTVGIGAVAAFAVGALAWQAHEDRALSIAAVDAPPDFASRGLSGRVLAGQLQDKLARLQSETVDATASAKVREAEEREIKLGMPEGGVSLGEVQHILQQWLSHETEVRLALSRPQGVPDGALVATIRAGEEPGEQIAQPDGDVDALLQKAAERAYEAIDPARFANWLDQHERTEEAIPLLRRLTQEGSALDRSRALQRLATLLAPTIPPEETEAMLQAAVRLAPNNHVAWNNLGIRSSDRETRLAYFRRAVEAYKTWPLKVPGGSVALANVLEDLGESNDVMQAIVCPRFGVTPCTDEAFAQAYIVTGKASDRVNSQSIRNFPNIVIDMAQRHDVKVASAMAAAPRPAMTGRSEAFQADTENVWLRAEQLIDLDREDWAGAISTADRMKPASGEPLVEGILKQSKAKALAHLGRFAEAEAALAQVEPNSSRERMLSTRALIANLKGDARGADALWSQAVSVAPSYPQARTEWAQALLKRGAPDAALALVKVANQKAPHFADALEVWGEALMAKGDFSEAAGRFAEAVKYAPNWGRLHWKWAQALAKAGKPDEARAQKQTASTLDLTAAERAEFNALKV